MPRGTTEPAVGPRPQLARRDDVKELLRFALRADPSSPEGAKALEIAKAASLRLAKELRVGDATKIAGLPDAERLAQEDFFRALLAQELPHLATRLQRVKAIDVDPDLTIPQPLVLQQPPSPTGVSASPLIHAASVSWSVDAGVLDAPTSFAVQAFVNGQPVGSPVAALSSPTVVGGLQAGSPHQFSVTARNAAGSSAPSALSAPPITPTGLPSALPGEPVPVQLPVFSSDPMLLLGEAAEQARADLAAPVAMANKWRYDHLRAVAVAAARDSLLMEDQIANVMAMALDKLGVAEQLTNNSLTEAVKQTNLIGAGLADVAGSSEVTDLLQPLADLAAESLLLPRFLAFLTRTSPLGFWTGLFGALISDLAAVVPLFGGDTDFDRTRRHLRQTFADDVDGIRTALRAEAQTLISELEHEVDAMVAPLRAAVAEVVAGTQAAMAEVFEASDLVLLMDPPAGGQGADVPDLDPFADLAGRLNAEIDRLAADIAQRIRATLQPLASGDPDLFVKICVIYLAIPLLAFLVISLAGGPFSAAVLAAIVLVAAQELVRLLVRWLTGPLTKKIDELTQRTTALVADLQRLFDRQAGVVRNQSPENLLGILAGQLRQLSDFLPQTFMEEAAAVLEEARDVVLRTGTQIAAAAEQALGQEHATAFDVIASDYTTGLTQAPQLPGGRDPRRLGGPALLADLGRLEEARLSLRDPKDLVFTHRLSLTELLGGNTAFEQFLTGGLLRLDLDEATLLDRRTPGVYRAQIVGLDVVGVAGQPLTTAAPSATMTVTHLGESTTRIKHDANPSAPPLALPDCLPASPEDLIDVVLSDSLLRADVEAALSRVDEASRALWVFALIIASTQHPDEGPEAVMRGIRQRLVGHLPDVIAQRTSAACCGLVDIGALSDAIAANIAAMPLFTAIDEYMFDPAGDADELISWQRLAELLAPRLRNGTTKSLRDVFTDLQITPARMAVLPGRFRLGRIPGLAAVLRDAHGDAVDAFTPHLAKWGDATLVSDPDPQVRALGFSRLVRKGEAESTVFNLLSAHPPLPALGGALLGSQAGNGMTSPRPQYGAFENRGLGGSLLLELTSPGPALVSLLSDIVLDVTVRGCFDGDLAQTVRSSTRQTDGGLGLVSDLMGGPGIQTPGRVPRLVARSGDLRTVHITLRGHRDRTLAVWQAAAQAGLTLPTQIRNALVGAPLGRDAAFAPLAGVSTFTLSFAAQDPPVGIAALVDMASTIRLGPADLGLLDATLAGLPVTEQARVAAVGLAVIPMPDGVHPAGVDPTAANDPLGVTLSGAGALAGVLPVPGPLVDRFVLGDIAPADQPLVTDLFDVAGTGVQVAFTGQDVFGDVSKLYDVIFSVSLRVPVPAAATSDAMFA